MALTDKLKNIADAIRFHTEKPDLLTLDEMAAGVYDVYDVGLTDGQEDANQDVWDAIQEKGARTDYTDAFYRWTQNNIRPRYDMTPTSLSNAFSNVLGDVWDLRQRLFACGVSLDTSKCSSFTKTFYSAKTSYIPIIDVTGCVGLTDTFYASSAITIEKLIVKETNTFNANCFRTSTLENITFEGTIGTNISFAYNAKLTPESVQSIIDHLKDLTGGTAQSLTVHATVGANITDEQKATITAKNWTLVY